MFKLQLEKGSYLKCVGTSATVVEQAEKMKAGLGSVFSHELEKTNIRSCRTTVGIRTW